MDTNILKTIEDQFKKKTLPNVEVGDTVKVTTMIRDAKGEKRRSQIFKGLVLAIKGSGIRQTVTVRKISGGVGVEKIIPIHSPNTESIEIIKKGNVRSSKIYYMRDRIGKSALKVTDSNKEVKTITYVEDEPVVEEVKEEKEEVKEEVKEEEKEVKEDVKKD